MYMKKYFLIFAAALVGLLVGCQREVNVDDSDIRPLPSNVRKVALSNTPVKLEKESENPDTKSVVTVDVENFACAYLFAFWHDTKEICAYQEEAGNLEGVKPVAVSVTEKTFNWALPVGQEIDVWVLVNPPSSLKPTLDDFVANGTDMTESELSGLQFECSSTSALLSLETSGDNMPMSGTMNGIILESYDSPLTLKVKRLFAKYEIKLDVTKFQEKGWTIHTARVDAAKSNTIVPYFYSGEDAGYRQETESNLKVIDTTTEEDKTELDFRDDGNKSKWVAFYFLENCQGDIFIDDDETLTASKWSTVYSELGSKVANCSYLDVCLRASKTGYGTRSFKYRVYLGNEASMNKNFDVIRNTSKKIVLKIDSPTDGIKFYQDEYRVAPGNSINVIYDTSLNGSEIRESIAPDDEQLSITQRKLQSNTKKENSSFAYTRTVTVKAASTAVDGTVYTFNAADPTGDISDNVRIVIDESARYYKLDFQLQYYTRKVGETSGVLIAQYGEINSLGNYLSAPTVVTAAATYTSSDPIHCTISSERIISATKGGVYTITASYDAPNGNTYTCSRNITFTDVYSYGLGIYTTKSTVEIGNTIQCSAYFEKYLNGDIIERTDVTNTASWSKSNTCVTVNKGLVSSTMSCEKAGVASFPINASYVKNGKTYTAEVILHFNPHEKDITYHWHWNQLGTSYEYKVVTSIPVPCDIKVGHIGGPSYPGFDGMYIYKGNTSSQTYAHDGGRPMGLTGSDPSKYFDSASDTKYWFKMSNYDNHSSVMIATFYKEFATGVTNLIPLFSCYRVDNGIYSFRMQLCSESFDLSLEGNRFYDRFSGNYINVENVIEYIAVKRGSTTHRLYPTTANSVGERTFDNVSGSGVIGDLSYTVYGTMAAWDSGFRSSNLMNYFFGAIPDNEEWTVTGIKLKSPYDVSDRYITTTEYPKGPFIG